MSDPLKEAEEFVTPIRPVQAPDIERTQEHRPFDKLGASGNVCASGAQTAGQHTRRPHYPR
jgi:hypothetical protein